MCSILSRVAADRVARWRRRPVCRLVLLVLVMAIVNAGLRPRSGWSAEREAPDTQAGEPDSVHPEARRLFEDGKLKLQAGAYDDAIRSFQGAYDLSPVPGLLYVLAQAHRLSGDCAAALSFYRRYLPVAPPEKNLRAKTEARIADMERCVASNPPAAPPVATPPAAVAPPATPPVLIAPSPAPVASETPRRRTVGVVLAGTALTLLATGGYFAWQTAEASDDTSGVFAAKSPWSPDVDAREQEGLRDQTIARAALITGTLVAAVASWYLLR